MILVGLSATMADAALVWEQTEIELHPAIDDATAVAHFKYQNKGDQPVNITNVKTSCGCTAASTNKNGVAPGEKGEITATFEIGGRIGLQQKAITVTTDDPAHPAFALNLKVQIPQTVELQPAFIFWKPGEEPAPKIILATVGKDFPITKLEASASSPDFSAKIEPGASKQEYQITVVPTQTTQGAAATIAINAERPDGTTKVFSATARVLPPAPPAGTTPAAEPVAAAPHRRLDACTLLTSEEIEKVQGEPLQEDRPSGNTSSVAGCYFMLPTASKSISLSVALKGEGPEAKDPKEFWQETFKKPGKAESAEEKSEGPEKVGDLGDDAYWTGDRVGGQLMVLKGDLYFKISVGGADDRATKLEKSKALARFILRRL